MLCACTADGTPAAPVQPQDVVASAEFVGARAALFLDTGTEPRRRVTFSGATDEIPGNSPFLPPFVDANLRALGPLAWSPSGRSLAMVATLALDQSQVVVTHADGSAARVASVNTQVIVSTPDWSPDEARLAYAMSTGAQATAVDLFMTDLGANRVQRLTTGLNYAQATGTIRFGSDGRSVLYAQATGDTGSPLFDPVCEVWRLDVTNGDRVRVAQGITGTIQSVARSGSWALVIRRLARLGAGDFDRALLRIPLVGGGPEVVLVPSGRLQRARLTNDDLHVLFVRDESATPGTVTNAYRIVSATGGGERAVRGTSAQTIAADVFIPR
ncbi:MAG TPA: hypothetical protein VFV33_19705 [Gemmatimonadaceae bacterium]|nr:hypothetical protein [Gemmatimonadaceae bacterium]